VDREAVKAYNKINIVTILCHRPNIVKKTISQKKNKYGT
jgi:hypothetical protein